MDEHATDLGQRVADLEQRVSALEGRRTPEAAATEFPPPPDTERFWALEELRRRPSFPSEDGSTAGRLVFAGTVHAPGAGDLVWQEEYPVSAVLAQEWGAAAGMLSALAHPIRLELVRRLLNGASTTQELATIPELGTSGQLYHHLRELQTAGLVAQRRRNHYQVAGEQVVRCLVMITAALSGTRAAPENEGEAR